MDHKPKVLQFIPSIRVEDGGTTTYMQQLTPSLGKLCQLHVCTMGSPAECVPLENCEVHCITSGMLHLRQMKRQWITLLDRIKPDVVHVNCCWLPQMALVSFWTKGYMKSNHVSMKLFLTPHGMLEPWIMRRNYWTRKLPAIWLFQRRSIRICDCLIATSEEEKSHILDLGWNTHVHIVQNGIDVDRVLVRSSWNAPHHLLFMSRIHPKKGLEILIDALDRLKKSDSSLKIRLSIVGDGEVSYVSQLKDSVSQKGLEELITFEGPIYGDSKWDMIRKADVVVLPSYSENYGLIVAESLASGTPVITTTGTPWRCIQDEGCGWWTEPDAESLLTVLKSLSDLTAEDVKTMGLKARNLAERDCSISSKVREIYQLYISNNT